MKVDAAAELASINNKLTNMEGELKTIRFVIKGSGYGEDGILVKQKKDREEILSIKKELNTLRRIRVELAFAIGLTGAGVKTLLDHLN